MHADRFKPSGRWILPAVCIATLCIPVLAWGLSTGGLQAYFVRHVPPGQTPFVFAKLCALIALVLFWLQCMTALARFAPALRGFFQLTRRQHAVLGVITFMFTLTHVALFLTASTLRTKHLALGQLLPQFGKGFYITNISFGAIALWLLVITVIAGWWRARGHAQLRWLHRAAFVVFALAFLHGINIGSETRFGLMKYIYSFIALSLTTAVLSWVWMRIRSRRAKLLAPSSSASAPNL